jgi:hypothetical protein
VKSLQFFNFLRFGVSQILNLIFEFTELYAEFCGTSLRPTFNFPFVFSDSSLISIVSNFERVLQMSF